MAEQGWDHATDLVVIGSGGGGMTAALTAAHHGLEALVLEGADVYGGSTAMSGGAVWVPNNPLMKAAGIDDSPEDGLAYLQAITEGQVEEARLRRYVEAAPAMLSFLLQHSRARFVCLTRYPDYYPDQPGARPGGRSLEATPYSGRKLGAEFPLLRPSHPQEMVLGRIAITAAEAHRLVQGEMSVVFRRMAAYYLDIPARLRSRRDNRLTLGNALCGRLRRSLAEAKIPLWLQSPAKALIRDGDQVVGVEVEQHGQRQRIQARRGVVLAAGGFPRNLAMRQQHQQAPISDSWTAASPDNLGTGIQLGQEAGGAIQLMEQAWWTPVTLVPGKAFSWILVVEKSMPGCVLVNQAGQRFTNESAPYIDVVNGMYAAHGASPSIPSYLVFDARYRERYPCGPLPPGRWKPDKQLKRKFREDFLNRAESLEALAERLGIDGAGLAATVERFNGFCGSGKDEDYQRGENLYDRYYSDPAVKPNPCLAPLREPPFYAIAVYPGDLGTKGGLVTDLDGRVQSEAGQSIPGLYAVGNCSASVMGPTYPGAGGTIGPSMTFGWLAARHAAGVRG